MQKLLLQSARLEGMSEIRAMLETSLPYPIFCATDLKEALDLLSRQMFNLLLYDTDVFGVDHFETLKVYRSRGFSSPVLVTAETVDASVFFQNRESAKLHWLPQPYSEKELAGLIRKLMASRKIPQQMFRRFRTNQNAAMEMLTNGEMFTSAMYNLSKGGAYCEYDGQPALSVGDLIRLRIPLKDVQRDHTLNARVVWTTKKGRFSGRMGMGLKFVKPEDVHRYLMEKV